MSVKFLDKKSDKVIGAVVIVLSLIGLLFIYSASCYSAEKQFSDAFHYVKTQSLALVVGVFFMFLLSYTDIRIIKKMAIPFYVISLLILGLVFVPVIGVESYGAKRWLNLGFFTIQPSEYAKFALVMLLALYMSKHNMKKFGNIIVTLLIGGLICLLIILEPNMSITICLVTVIFIMLFIGGAKIWHLLLLLLPAVAGAVALVLLEPYRLQRLSAFINPWASPLEEGYQLIQSYYALGSGGLFGIGIFNSRQKYLFLPFAESDFILSVLGEETGLFGVLFIMVLSIIVIYRGIRISSRAEDRFSSYLACGITSIFAVQTAMNMAVVCGAVPPTGLPLPFLSAGGSSLVAYFSAIGLLMSISRGQNVVFGTNVLKSKDFEKRHGI